MGLIAERSFVYRTAIEAQIKCIALQNHQGYCDCANWAWLLLGLQRSNVKLALHTHVDDALGARFARDLMHRLSF